MKKIPVIIDCDPGVDDVLAIILGIYHPGIEILGICSVTGNGNITNTTRNAKNIVTFCNRKDIPIYKGADTALDGIQPETISAFGDDGLGGYADTIESNKEIEVMSAVEYLIHAVHSQPDEITLLAIGPCTNIAKAIRQDSSIVSKVKRLVIMGGAKHTGNMSPVAEYNFWADPQAAKEVLQAGFEDVVIIGLDVTFQITMDAEIREALRIIDTPLSKLIYDITRKGVDDNWDWERKAAAPMHDVLTMAYLLDETLLDLEKANVDIVTEGIAKGQSIVDYNGKWNQGICNARFAKGVDINRFYHLFLTTVFNEHKEDFELLLSRKNKG